MAKTQEEIDELKHEYETLTTKLKELSQDELIQVIGGEDGLEEFDWHRGEYYTPAKQDEHSDDKWEFSAIGNVDGQYFKQYKNKKNVWDKFNRK